MYIFIYRVWFRRPSTNIRILKERQKAIAFFQSPQNVENTSCIQDCLKHIKCITVGISYQVYYSRYILSSLLQ